MTTKLDCDIMIEKDGKFYVGYCLEIPQAMGQGNTMAKAIWEPKKCIKLCKLYIENKMNQKQIDQLFLQIDAA
jgi:predicted RNase H-like HicB family nuclease